MGARSGQKAVCLAGRSRGRTKQFDYQQPFKYSPVDNIVAVDVFADKNADIL